MFNPPLRAPAAAGVKLTVTVHEAPAARLAPQVVPAKPNSLPEADDTAAAVGTVRFIATPPVLLSVAVALLPCPICVVAKTGALSAAAGAVPRVALAPAAVPALAPTAARL